MNMSRLSRPVLLSLAALVASSQLLLAENTLRNVGPNLDIIDGGSVGAPGAGSVIIQRRGTATTSVIDDLSDPAATGTLDVTGSGDNLGDHIATRNLKMGSEWGEKWKILGAAEVHSDHVFALNYFYFSDEALKRDVETLSGEEAIALIRSMRPVRYVLRETGAPAMGVIAQEVELILPEIVRTGEDGIKSVDYVQLIAPLLATIQQLEARVSELEAAAAP